MPVNVKRRLLFLSPRVPHPLNNGAKIRTAALLRALCEEFVVDYAGFLQPELEEQEARRALEACATVTLAPERSGSLPSKMALVGKGALHPWPVTILKYQHPTLIDCGRKWFAENPQGIVHADHIHMAPYLQLGNCRLKVIDEHNVEAQILDRAAEFYKPAGKLGRSIAPLIRNGLGIQARRMRRSEAGMVAQANLTLAVSDGDAEQLRAMAPGARVEVIPNGVDADYFSPASVQDRKPRQLVFTGSMNWLPNEDAVLYFCREIKPALDGAGTGGEWRLDIVGQNPTPAVLALASKTVRITGTVDDVRPYNHAARVFIVPLRIGGGSRLKILEAFAMGIPVVSTSVGCEGLGATDGLELLIADTPETFVRQIERLESDTDLWNRLARHARQFVLERYTWGAIGRRLQTVYANYLEP